MSSRSKSIAFRALVATIPAVLILIWAVAQLDLGKRQTLFERIPADGGTELLDLASERTPPASLYYLRASDLLSKRLFPADHPRALGAAARALALEPLNSRAWMIVAREKLYLGQDSGAEAALEFSDQIDPRWPRQRLESVRLWTLLDKPERGLKTAHQIATLGSDFSIEVARELLSSGYSPAEVFEELEVRNMTPSEIADVVRALRTGSLKQMEEIYSHLPESAYKDAEFRRKMYSIAQNPISFGQLIDIWRWESPYLMEMGDSRWLDNPELRHPPFTTDFPLGWQNIGVSTEFSLHWEPPSADALGERTGRLRLTIPSYGPNTYRYRLYRLLIPAGEPVTIRSRVRCEPAFESQATFRVRVGEEWYGDDRTDPAKEEWRDLSVDLPSYEMPVIAEVYLNWARTFKAGTTGSTALDIDGIELVPSTAILAPSSFSEEVSSANGYRIH